MDDPKQVLPDNPIGEPIIDPAKAVETQASVGRFGPLSDDAGLVGGLVLVVLLVLGLFTAFYFYPASLSPSDTRTSMTDHPH